VRIALIDYGAGNLHSAAKAVERAFAETGIAGSVVVTDDAKIVADALRHFDGERCELASFVVMPNHVHVLMQCLGEHRMKAQVTAWKKYSARCLHEALGRKGHFWLGETYDHIVRSREQFEHYQRYIRENPVKAKLGVDEATVWMP
jgi:REP element-mobilizing transposase RayT